MTLECNSSSFVSCIFNPANDEYWAKIALELHAYITEHGLGYRDRDDMYIVICAL